MNNVGEMHNINGDGVVELDNPNKVILAIQGENRRVFWRILTILNWMSCIFG